jgi:hypothetical protein
MKSLHGFWVRFSAITLLLFSALVPVRGQSECTPQPWGLAGWWRGETNLIDHIGTNHGTVVGNTTFGAGRVGQAFVFDGDRDAVSVGNPPELQLQNFTIEAWIKRSSATLASLDPDQAGNIFGCAWGGYDLGIWDDGRLLMGKVGYSAVSSTLAVTDISSFHHVAVTKNGSTVVFYLDGVAETVGPYDPGFIFEANGTIAIGARGHDYATGFLGAVDEVSVYNRALSATEIQAVYSAGSYGKCTISPPQIIAQPSNLSVRVGDSATFSVTATGTLPLSYQWRFNGANIDGAVGSSLVLHNVQFTNAGDYSVSVFNSEGSAASSNAVLTVNPPLPCATQPTGLIGWWKGEANALDEIGISHGTLQGQATYASGRVGQGFLFDGSGDGAFVGNPLSLRLQDFTIEAWIRRGSSTAASLDFGGGVVFGYGQGGYALAMLDNGALLLTRIGVDNVVSDAIVADTSLHHVAVTKVGTTVVFYLDGIAYTVPSYSTSYTFSSSAAIGARGDNLGNSFLGTIDEVSVYSRALAPSELQAIYSAGSSGKCVVPIVPFIIAHPQSLLVAEGGNASFSVAAGGTPPLSYQWSLNGTPLANATNASLALTGVTTSQAGDYSVLVSNLHGQVTSSNATLTVRVLGPNLFDDFDPEIDTMQWAGFGGTVRATNYGGFISASNSLWFGGTGSRFATTRPLNTSQGAGIQFYLRLANGGPPLWERVDLPTKGIVLESSTNSGVNWTQLSRYDTTNYTNWTSVSLVIPPGAQAPNTQFRWRQLLNSGSTSDHWALDDVAVITGPVAPFILSHPTAQTVIVGGTATFSAAASGTLPLSYQWRFNETNVIAGATNNSLVLTNVQLTAAGAYSVVITNAAGSVTSSNALLTVNLPPATVAVTSLSAESATAVSLPLTLAANGNENAAGFSLNFDPAKLSYTGVALGSGASAAALLVNTNELATGKLGVALALPTDTVFAAGAHEILRVGFTTAILTSAAVTTVGFGDVPISRLVSGTAGNVLSSAFTSGTVSIAAANYEGDITPRPDGDRKVVITDWVLEGRYAARLDYPTNATEFQRADCAPRATLGDGLITVTDWVQAGRYAAALDPLTVVGGPSTEGGGGAVQAAGGEDREISVTNGMLLPSQTTAAVGVQLKAVGDENALGFSLSFDPAKLAYSSATLGSGAAGATWNVNASQAATGKLGIVLALSTGNSFAAGTHEVVKLNFSAATTAPCDAALTLTDQPVPRQVSSPGATVLPASYVNGTMAVNPQPGLGIGRANENVLLSWPGWGSNYVLQASGTLSGGWTNVGAAASLINSQLVVTQAQGTEAVFYRLKQ